MPEYALILLLLLIVTFVLQRTYHITIYSSTRHLVLFNLGGLLVTVAWDHIAIGRGHWSFGEQFLLGPKIGLMPIEEFGFVLIGSYFVLVLYKLVDKYLRS